MQPVADRVPRKVFSVACGCLFAILAMLSAEFLRAQAVVPDSQPVSGLQLELKRSDAQQQALLQLLAAQQTPGSASYRKWLTPEEFADRFAPDAKSQQAAADWLQQQGFQVTGTARNGMRVAFRGSAAQVQRAFAVPLEAQVTGGTPAVAVRSRASLPPALAARALRLAGSDTDASAVLSAALDANTQAAVVVPSAVPVRDVEIWQELLAEAAAQGITVLEVNGGGLDAGGASAAVLASAASAAQAGDTTVSRPDWQSATGLPANGPRMMPDAVLGDAATLVDALNASAQQHGRVGALAPQMYRLASGHGIFSHAEQTAAEGTWTAADGLGTVNVTALVRALATGTTGVNVALATSGTTVTHGQPLSLTYTVTGTGGTPTGTVTATLKGRSGNTVTLGPLSVNASGVATFSTGTLPGDVYDIAGTYSGDSTFAAGVSNTVTSTVSPENVALTATAPATAVGGMIPVTVTATSASGVGVPSGTVTITQFGPPVTTFTAVLPSSNTSSASAVVNVPATSAGQVTLQASCTSNASFACNQPTSLIATVTQGTPTVTLSSTPEALVSNSATQKYDLAVTVVPPAAATAVTPTGTVALQNNGVTFATVSLTKGAVAYVASLAGAGNNLTAVYNGDTNYVAATSTAVMANAPLIPTMTSIAASPIAITFGSGTSLTASVTPGSYAAAGSPTGTITFKSSLQGVVGTATLGNGFVTYNLATLQVGTHSITATYGGDTNYATSVSGATTVTVAQGKASTTTTLTVSPQTPLAGQPTTFTATVVASFNVPAGTPTPSVTCTGQVTFFQNNIFVANGSLSGGKVTVTGKLPAGSNALTAVYGGDTQCYGSTSAVVVVPTAKVAAAVTLQPSVGYANAGQTIQLTATLAGADPATIGVPTGTVVFYDMRGGSLVTLGTAMLGANGSNTNAFATINVNGSSAGQHNFQAVYSGDAIFLPATSATAVLLFGDFSVSMNPSSLTIPRGGSGSAVASVSVSSGFSASVVLTCVPPGGSLITCTFQPSAVTAGGSAGLTVTTAVQSSRVVPASRAPVVAEAGGTLLGLFLLPFARLRRFGGLLLLVCWTVIAAGGCGVGMVDSTNNLNNTSTSPTSGSGGTATNGTPLGTQLLTINAASSDGTLRHTYTFPVTVQ